MGVSKSLRQLTALAEQLETSENEITELAIQNADLLTESGHEVDLTVELPFPVGGDASEGVDLTATDATVTDAGTLSVELTACIVGSSDGIVRDSAVNEDTSSVDTSSADTSSADTSSADTSSAVNEVTDGGVTDGEVTDGEVTDGGSTVAASEGSTVAPSEDSGTDAIPEDADSLRRSRRSTSEPDADREATDAPSMGEGATEDSDRPRYKDPERLAEVYDPDRSFAEMTEELGVDVTPKTVRHYMVEHGIHDPDSLPSSDSDGESPDWPAYRDPERLAEVYDPERTFPEMADELGVDVTPQTVRNHMVEHGIHDPDPKTESASGDDDSFLAETEDERLGDEEIAAEIAAEVELPDDVTLSDVTEAVCTAKTLYHVQRELGIDRDQTHRLLSELDLLELVHGRLSTTSGRSRSREEVEERIEKAVTDAAIAE